MLSKMLRVGMQGTKWQDFRVLFTFDGKSEIWRFEFSLRDGVTVLICVRGA